MKKTLIAIALAAMMAPAWGAEVVSSNVVGYNKITLKPGYNAISGQFVPVGAETVSDILSIADCTVLPSMDPDTETGFGFARLQTWDPTGGYTTYEWTGEGIAEAWEQPGIDNKWMTVGAGAVAENVLIGVGDSFWLWLDPTCENLSDDISAVFTNPAKPAN